MLEISAISMKELNAINGGTGKIELTYRSDGIQCKSQSITEKRFSCGIYRGLEVVEEKNSFEGVGGGVEGPGLLFLPKTAL